MVVGAERFPQVYSISLLYQYSLLTIRRGDTSNYLHRSQSIPDPRVVGDQALAAATDAEWPSQRPHQRRLRIVGLRAAKM